MDIGQALTYLQDQVPPDAELIFGTTENPNIQGQVQVNLIVTGLGADTFDDVFNAFPRENRDIPDPVMRKEPQDIAAEDDGEPAPQRQEIGRDPLDVPAFMRRRAYANISFGS
jgi:cell division protein FtsZ